MQLGICTPVIDMKSTFLQEFITMQYSNNDLHTEVYYGISFSFMLLQNFFSKQKF